MIKFIYCALFIIISCTGSQVPLKYENQLTITKRYIGQVAYTEIRDKYTVVVCGFEAVELVGQVHVPAFVHGYVRTEKCYYDVHPDIRRRLEHKYFSYTGSKEYKVKTW